ncbi:MAG: 4Fe-4S binding protein [Armatimonadota bacterium]
MKTRTILMFITLIALVVGTSLFSNSLWNRKNTELSAQTNKLQITSQTTIQDIALAYHLEPRMLKKPFHLQARSDFNKTITELGISPQSASEMVKKLTAIEGEESSKNWKKILAKFLLWFTFLAVMFRQMRRDAITPKLHKMLLLTSVVIFGVIMGSDPSPMGTVKDAIVLWGKEHIIFPPRMVAFIVFSLMVVLANKFICSWGCQFGTLQDLVFRLNRNGKDSGGIMKQWKPSFAFTNGIRIAFFLAITVFAVTASTDIVGPIDPFKIFSPISMGIGGIVFITGILVLSLFVYRPWCHMFCPFGLVGWVLERFSIYKIKVNYDTCMACESCAKACPSTVMGAILKQDRTVPDCFSCGTCQAVCPTKSISFDHGRRVKPPHRKFADTQTKQKQLARIVKN